jgi:hypothetical protein
MGSILANAWSFILDTLIIWNEGLFLGTLLSYSSSIQVNISTIYYIPGSQRGSGPSQSIS